MGEYNGLTFKIGDRVLCAINNPDDNRMLRKGMLGTVIVYEGDPNEDFYYGVKWDDYIGGHTMDGNCENGYGWFVKEEQIEHANEDMEDAEISEGFLYQIISAR